jgi:polysaccharide pyruvyl transferase WcaK-like protein
MVQKVGLLNHMGGGNLGDDATQDAVVQNIKTRWPNAEIFLFSMNPADTRLRHGIPSYPIRTETFRGEKRVNRSLAVRAKITNAFSKRRVLLQILQAINTAVLKVPRALFEELPFLRK